MSYVIQRKDWGDYFTRLHGGEWEDLEECTGLNAAFERMETISKDERYPKVPFHTYTYRIRQIK